MFTEFKLKNFKSFRNLVFRPGRLNVLTGLNGSGKSSLLQYILLLRETAQRSSMAPWLVDLNHSPLAFGTYADLKYAYAQTDEEPIEMSFRMAGYSDEYRFFIDESDPTAEEVKVELAENTNDVEQDDRTVASTGTQEDWSKMLDYLRGIQYVSAFRLPPRQEHAYSSLNVRGHRWGAMGEYAVAYLAEYGMKTLVEPALCHPSEIDQHLQSQVDAWMGIISPGVGIVAENLPTINRARLSVSFAKGVNKHSFRPQNVGFGISYVLPLLIMVLRSRPGDCLVIENPEAHLHPRGQAEFGRLLALAAANGVQIFVETHSDHVINGIRVAVKNAMIGSDDVRVAFVGRTCSATTDDEYVQESVVNVLHIDASGEFDDFPDGFLDEWNRQLLELVKP